MRARTATTQESTQEHSENVPTTTRTQYNYMRENENENSHPLDLCAIITYLSCTHSELSQLSQPHTTAKINKSEKLTTNGLHASSFHGDDSESQVNQDNNSWADRIKQSHPSWTSLAPVARHLKKCRLLSCER